MALRTALNPDAKAYEKGIIFPKVTDIFNPGDIGKYLGEIDPTLFQGKEAFGFLIVADIAGSTFTTTIELTNGVIKSFTPVAGVWYPVQGLRIIATTASIITVLAGQ